MKNLMVWARKYVEYEGFDAFNKYLLGNATFAEAAIAVMENLVEKRCIQDVRILERNNVKEFVKIDLDAIRDRYDSGEDPEAILRSILHLRPSTTMPSGTPASPLTKL